jgi:3-oxoadipate CoA-transferase alpha subunit
VGSSESVLSGAVPINKIVDSLDAALAGVDDGSTLMINGFGGAGAPTALLEGLVVKGLRNLTVISNNAGSGRTGLAALLASGAVSRIICSYPRMPGSVVFEELYQAGRIHLEVCPQGTLSERIRAGGAGIGGFYTQVGVGTELAADRETREIDGKQWLLELPLRADFALIRAHRADRWGNLVYRKAARNFAPTMAMAGVTTVVEAERVVDLGELDPERVVTPGVFVDRVFEVAA